MKEILIFHKSLCTKVNIVDEKFPYILNHISQYKHIYTCMLHVHSYILSPYVHTFIHTHTLVCIQAWLIQNCKYIYKYIHTYIHMYLLCKYTVMYSTYNYCFICTYACIYWELSLIMKYRRSQYSIIIYIYMSFRWHCHNFLDKLSLRIVYILLLYMISICIYYNVLIYSWKLWLTNAYMYT